MVDVLSCNKTSLVSLLSGNITARSCFSGSRLAKLLQILLSFSQYSQEFWLDSNGGHFCDCLLKILGHVSEIFPVRYHEKLRKG